MRISLDGLFTCHATTDGTTPCVTSNTQNPPASLVEDDKEAGARRVAKRRRDRPAPK